MDNCLNEAPGFSPRDWLLSVGESFIDKIGWEPRPGNVNQPGICQGRPYPVTETNTSKQRCKQKGNKA